MALVSVCVFCAICAYIACLRFLFVLVREDSWIASGFFRDGFHRFSRLDDVAHDFDDLARLAQPIF